MRLTTTVDTVYLPDEQQEFVARLGLHPLHVPSWIDCDTDFTQFHQHKLEQAASRLQSVYGELPGSERAVREFVSVLQQHLLAQHSDQYAMHSHALHHTATNLSWQLPAANLWEASLWIQEDICLLQDCDGEFKLTAASVCSPSNWHPAEKLGKSLDRIHQPVPGYEEKLARRVNSLFHALKPGKPLLRYNWSLQPGNELYWRDSLVPRDPAAEQYWRVERQTLRRLPESGAIVFLIRIYLHKRSAIERDPAIKSILSALLNRLPSDEKRYKGLAS